MSAGNQGKHNAAINGAYVGNYYGAVPVIFHKNVDTAAGVAGTAVDIVAKMPFRFHILFAYLVVKTTSGGVATVTIYNGSNAVSNAMAAQTADTTAFSSTLDDTYRIIAKDGSLKAMPLVDSVDADVYVVGFKYE